jgi:hypothetical protein
MNGKSKVQWDKQHYSEYDGIVGDNDYDIEEPIAPVRQQPMRRPPPTQPAYEDYGEEDAPVQNPGYKFNKQDKNLMNTVGQKLEIARIYESLAKCDLFGDFEADPKAIEQVRAEIKQFLMEKLENLFNVSTSKRQSNQQMELSEMSFELPFNEEEVAFLKALAFKGTQGASAQSPTAIVTSKPKLQAKAPSAGIKGLSKSNAPVARRPQPNINRMLEREEATYEEEEDDAPLPTQVFKPIKNKRTGQLEMSDAEAEAEALKELRREAKKPRASKKREEDIYDRNERISREQAAKKAVNPNAVPMMTPEMQIYAATSKQQLKEGSDANYGNIVNKVLQSKSRK